jgi:four helix bundle protein
VPDGRFSGRKQRQQQRQQSGSASSVPANLAEGHGRTGRDRTRQWRIAYASAKEVDCHLRLLCLSKAVPSGKATKTLQLVDEVRAMTWRLLNP